MQNFTSFISEAKSAPLYHSTTFGNVVGILEAGFIEPSDNGYLSTTRSKRVAKNWSDGVVFVIDQQPVSRNQKIIPTDWSAAGGSTGDTSPSDDGGGYDSIERRGEREESIKGKVSLKHVDQLWLPRKYYDQLFGPETREEKGYAKEIEAEPDMVWLYDGLLYSDRLQQQRDTKKALSKYRIKLVKT